MSSKDHKSSSKEQSGKHKSASLKNREFLTTEDVKKSKNKDKSERAEYDERRGIPASKEEELIRDKSKFRLADKGELGEKRRSKVESQGILDGKAEKRSEPSKSGKNRSDNAAVVDKKRANIDDVENEGGERRRHKRDNEDEHKRHKRDNEDEHKRHKRENEIENKRHKRENEDENKRHKRDNEDEHKRHKRENEDEPKRHKRTDEDERRPSEKKQNRDEGDRDDERRRKKHDTAGEEKSGRERRDRNENSTKKHRLDQESPRGGPDNQEEVEEQRRRKERRHRRKLEELQRQQGESEQLPHGQGRSRETRTVDRNDQIGPSAHVEADDSYDDDFEVMEEPENGGQEDDECSSTPSKGSRRDSNSAGSAVAATTATASTRPAATASNSAPRGTAVATAASTGPVTHTSFINFKIAHKRRCHDQVANAMLCRAFDLSRLIDMDRVSYDIMDVPPVLEHNQYMRLMGRAGCEHEASQTGDDSVGRDIQTEQVETRPGWTQCPAAEGQGDGGCGDGGLLGDPVSPSAAAAAAPCGDGVELDIDRVSLVRLTGLMETILVEETRFELAPRQPAAGRDAASGSLSKGYNQFSVVDVQGGASQCCCTLACFPGANSDVFATVLRQKPHGNEQHQQQSTAPAESSSSACIAIWNVSGAGSGGSGGGGPQMQLRCSGTAAAADGTVLASSQVTCISFSPDAGPSHLLAGLSSGVLALWDLREPTVLPPSPPQSQSPHSNSSSGDWQMLSPAYMTACAGDPTEAEQWSHRGPITALQTVAASQVGGSARGGPAASSYQLLSLDALGRLSIWLASAIPTAHSGPWAVAAGSLSDLNLRPGSRFRLSRVSTVELATVSRSPGGGEPPHQQQQQLVMTCMATDPGNTSSVFIGTGSGQLLCHQRALHRRHGRQSLSDAAAGAATGVAAPQVQLARVMGRDEAFSAGAVTQIDFYPFFEQYLLAGYDDGAIRIFAVLSAKAILTFQFREGVPVLQLRWSRSHPAVFLSLDAQGSLCVWNVLSDIYRPVLVQQLPGFISFDLSSDSQWQVRDRRHHSTKNSARLLLWALDGRVEVHELADALSSPELDDSFKTSSLFQSLL